MAKRSYRQFCALARALDVVGERWTLLLVRELLVGPKRFKMLGKALPAMGPNLLSQRLKELAEAGIVEKNRLSAPADVEVYELTEFGRGLRNAVVALAQWGKGYLAKPKGKELWRADWTVLALEYTFHPERAVGVEETYELRIDDVVLHAEVRDGELRTAGGAAREPGLVITSDKKTFLALARGTRTLKQAEESGKLEVQGKRRALERFLKIFSLDLGG